MTSNYRDWNGVLNQLAGLAPGTLDAQGAANVWAGQPQSQGWLDLIGALNKKANTTGLGLNHVCNVLAGLPPSNGLDALAALNHAAGNSPD